MKKKFLSILSIAALVTMLTVTVVSARIYNPVSVDTSSFLTTSSTPTLTGLWNFSSGASVSGSLEVSGTASISGNVSFKGNSSPTGTWDFTNGTLKVPSAATPTVSATGVVAVNTGSASIQFFDGTRKGTVFSKTCPWRFTIVAPTAGSGNVTIGQNLLGGFTVTQIISVASSSGGAGHPSVGFNVYHNSNRTTITTPFFAVSHNASSSTGSNDYSNYVQNTNVPLNDFIFTRITSASAESKDIHVEVCGTYK